MIDPAPHIDTVEPRRLALVQRYAALDLVADDQFDTFIRLARTILDVPIAAISLVHRDHQQFMARIGLEVAETPRAQSFCAHGCTAPNRCWLKTQHAMVASGTIRLCLVIPTSASMSAFR